MVAKKKSASLIFIFFTVLVDMIGIGIIIPVIPSLIQSLDGGSLSDASEIGGWLMFAFAFMQFFCAPIMGQLSDRFGRKPILVLALFGLGLDYLFHAFAPTIFWLFVGRIIAGFFGASFTVANAYIADISTQEDKAKNFGMVGAAFGLGFIIGPVIGGIAGKWGVQMPFFVAAGFSFLNMLYGLFVVPESLTQENRRNFNFKRANPIASLLRLKRFPMMLGMVAAFFLIYMAGKSVETTWAYYTMLRFDWDISMVGYSLAFVGVLVAIVQGGLVGIISKRLGAKKTILYGFGFWTLGLILFAFAQEGWQMYAFCLVYCMGGIAGPTMQSLMSNQVPTNEQGELQGALTSLMSVTAIIGPPIMTGIFASFTKETAMFEFPGAAFSLGAILAFSGLLFAYSSLKKFRTS